MSASRNVPAPKRWRQIGGTQTAALTRPTPGPAVCVYIAVLCLVSYLCSLCSADGYNVQMQSPEMQSLLNNPRALQAMMQIQAGLSQLQLEAPSLAQMPGFALHITLSHALSLFYEVLLICKEWILVIFWWGA